MNLIASRRPTMVRLPSPYVARIRGQRKTIPAVPCCGNRSAFKGMNFNPFPFENIFTKTSGHGWGDSLHVKGSKTISIVDLIDEPQTQLMIFGSRRFSFRSRIPQGTASIRALRVKVDWCLASQWIVLTPLAIKRPNRAPLIPEFGWYSSTSHGTCGTVLRICTLQE